MTESNLEEYEFLTIEKKWQKFWKENKTFKTSDDLSKPKYYILDMFPYPSGNGLHVGHPEGYTATDILARYKRMKGFNVLHPMGWDAFGLPAEQYAIETGTHPGVTTEKNIERFRQQIESLGLSYDWDREINTTDPEYYKWTQWIFLKLFEKGLAYESYEPVNWCPALGTVLANEEVIDGKSERGSHPVEKRPIRQWVLKITAYAERLLEDLEELDWPDSVKEMQRNWIGKSVGAEVTFKIKGRESDAFKVFTTRPDTLFGATFCVMAPEHPLVEKIVGPKEKAEVEVYIEKAKNTSEIERSDATKEKSGVFTGSYAINPVNGESLPIYVADYVLMGYGEGAIMAVPGHDERDHQFAGKYSLPIIRVLTGGEQEDITKQAHTGDGTLINSEFLNGLDKSEAIKKITTWLEEKNLGKKAVNYKLRDWLFSRQRYWGEPFPIVKDQEGNLVPVEAQDLPVILPDLEDFKPTGSPEGPLAKAADWLECKKDGKIYQRETNTMPQWAGSCWYYLRYIDPNNNEKAWDLDKENYWMPVDLYIGGMEHAVLHLLYARFWHKVLFDCGLVSTKEPFQKLVNQGMILGENGEKMSKSRGNVVNPDDVIAQFGADSLRLYEMFMGPLEATKPWQTKSIDGVHRFLKRSWRMIVGASGSISEKINEDGEDPEFTKTFHKTLKKVEEDIAALRFNTAIAAMMEFVNLAYKQKSISYSTAEKFLLILSPFAPHMSEELWERLGNRQSLAYAEWPVFDPELVVDDLMTVSIQVNGKLRGTLSVSKSIAKSDILEQAKKLEGVHRHIDGKNLIREIYVPGKIVNFVAK